MRRILHIDTEVKDIKDMRRILTGVLMSMVQEAVVLGIKPEDLTAMMADVTFTMLFGQVMTERKIKDMFKAIDSEDKRMFAEVVTRQMNKFMEGL